MNILVCVKQVLDAQEIKVDSATNVINTSRAPLIISPYDANAVEAAVQLKEAHGGTVTVLSMGSDKAKAVLKECISVGADKGVLVSDASFEGSDPFATSHILAATIKKLGTFDLVLCGKQATDDDNGQVGNLIAEQLGMTPLTFVSKIDVNGNVIVVNREQEDGKEIIEAQLPAVCSVVDSINKPRYATVKSKLAANKAQFDVVTAADLPDLDQSMIGANSLTKTIEVYVPPKKKAGVRIKEGSAAESGAKLAKLLIAEKVI